MIRRGNHCGKPARGIPSAAPNIDNAQRFANPSLTNRSDNRLKKVPDPLAVIELLSETLHLPVDGEEQQINFAVVKDASVLGQSQNRAQRFAIMES